MSSPSNTTIMGPYNASDIRPGEPYELSNGHIIECMGTGQRGSRNNAGGALLLGTDPDVRSVGVDTGISPHAKMLRAPDLVIGDIEDKPGWAPQAPPFAVEYADTGQDDVELRKKIAELLGAGTQLIWVVRQHGQRCVEVHAPDAPIRLVRMGEMLEAPGILRNPVPVSALYDPDEAKRLALRNLLQREGYESLQAVKDEGRKLGLDEGRLWEARATLRRLLERRNLTLTNDEVTRIEQCSDHKTLQRWFDAAIVASTTLEVFI